MSDMAHPQYSIHLTVLAPLPAVFPHPQLRPQWGIPRASELAELLRTMGPLTVVSMSKNTCYLIVQTTAATLSTLCLAAHQAAFSVWALATWTISPIGEHPTCMPLCRYQYMFLSKRGFAGILLHSASGSPSASRYVPQDIAIN